MNSSVTLHSAKIAEVLPDIQARLEAAGSWLSGDHALSDYDTRADVVSEARAHPMRVVHTGVAAYLQASDPAYVAYAQIMTAIGLYWWGYHREAQIWLEDVAETEEADRLYHDWYMFLCQRVRERKRDINYRLLEIADALEEIGDTSGAWQCRQDAALEWTYYDAERAAQLLNKSESRLEAEGRTRDVCLGKLRLILIYINIGTLDDIPALFDDIEAAVIPEEMPGLDCLKWMYRAKYAVRCSEMQDSLTYSEGAQVRAEAMQHLYFMAVAKIDLSIRYLNQGEIEIARTIDAQALTLAEELDWSFGIATATMHLGNYELLQGNYDAARQYYLVARAQFEALDETIFHATCNLNLGIVAQSQNAFSEALDLVETARREYERYQQASYLALAHHNLGKIYASFGLTDEAIPQFETSIAVLLEGGSSWQSVRSQIFLARILIDLPDDSDHLKAEYLLKFSRLQAEAKELRQDVALVSLAEADLAYRRAQYAKALDGYREVVARTNELRQHELANEAMLGIAASHLRRVEVREAEDVLERLDYDSLPAVFKWRFHFLQARLHLLTGDIQPAKAQYQAAIRHLGQARIGIANDNDRAHFVFRLHRSFDEAFAFADRLGDVHLALQIVESISGSQGYANRADGGEDFEGYVAELRRRLTERYGDGWTVLRYYRHTDRFFVFRITPEDVTLRPIDDLGSDDSAVRMCANPDDSFRRRVYDDEEGTGMLSGRRMRQSLYDAFIRPVLPDDADADHLLIIVPSRELHGLPFHTLLDGDTPLIMHSEVAYAQSLTALMSVLSHERVEQPLLDEPGVILAQSTFVSEHYPDLRYVQTEVEAIEAQARGVVMHLSPDEVDSAHLHDIVQAQEPKPYHWLHIATHSAYDRRQSLSSGLVMGDDLISIETIRQWRTDLRLVTMSACQTASWRWMHGEIIISLTSAFLQAGAGTVVASQWDVYDQTTARLMALFYQRLAEGDRPSRAMAAVQRAMQRAAISSYHWGTFGVYGLP